MRRLIIFTVLAAGVFLVMRKIAERAGPAIREGCSEMCERMLAKQGDPVGFSRGYPLSNARSAQIGRDGWRSHGTVEVELTSPEGES